MAVVAAGSHNEPLHEQGLAVDALLVLGSNLGVLHLVFVGEVLVRVALRAGLGEVHLVDRRICLLHGNDVVVPMAIGAVRRGRGAHGLAHAVDAALVDLVLLGVTGSALHLRHRVAVPRMVLVDLGMAGLAGERCVHRPAKPGGIHEERHGGAVRPLLGEILIAVAIEAALLRGRLGRRGLQRRGHEEARDQGQQEASAAALAAGGSLSIRGRSGHGSFLWGGEGAGVKGVGRSLRSCLNRYRASR